MINSSLDSIDDTKKCTNTMWPLDQTNGQSGLQSVSVSQVTLDKEKSDKIFLLPTLKTGNHLIKNYQEHLLWPPPPCAPLVLTIRLGEG